MKNETSQGTETSFVVAYAATTVCCSLIMGETRASQNEISIPLDSSCEQCTINIADASGSPEFNEIRSLAPQKVHSLNQLILSRNRITVYLLGPFHGAIAVPSVTRCRCRCRRCRRGHRFAACDSTGSDTW